MRIVIVGGGIAGLSLAAALKAGGMDPTDMTIYERENDPASRHSAAVSLKGDVGMAALASLGLADRVIDTSEGVVGRFVFTNQAGAELIALPSTGEHITYRVRRARLHEELLAAAEGVPIRTGAECTGYRENRDGVTVSFAGADPVHTDLLVACDGVNSAVRSHLVGDERRYLGLTAIVGTAKHPTRHPLLDGGYFMTLGRSGASLFGYPQSGDVYFSFTVPSDVPTPRDAPSDILLRELHDGTQDWHRLIRELADQADPETVRARNYYDRDPLSSVHSGRVWLLGDAAHPMSPFQGLGANLALADAVSLAPHLLEASAGTGAEVDRVITARGRKAVLQSRRAAQRFHATGRAAQASRNLGLRIGGLAMRAAPARR